MSRDSSKHAPERHQEHAHSERAVRIHWGPAAAILYTLFVFFGAQFLTGVVFGILALIFGLSALGFVGDNPTIATQFYFVLINDVAILSALWLFLRARRNSFRQLGLDRRPVWADAGYAVLGYLVYYGLLVISFLIVGSFTDINLQQKQELGFDNLLSPVEKAMGFMALVLLPPIVEEFLFRGFLFGGLRTKLSFAWATFITSVLFAVPHLFASSEGLLWVAGIDTFILSIILCYLREKTGALWAPMAIHGIKNAIAYTILVTGIAAV